MDLMLIKKCIAGDRGAQLALYNLFSPTMLIVCLRYANDKQEAEDILQEGFIKIFVALHQYKNIGSFEGWVRKIMVNTALQRIRKKATLRPIYALETVEESLFLNNTAITNLSAKELLYLVQKLPTAYRMVFNLYVFEGYKHKEIAQLLSITEGTSKSNLSDARNILQKLITSQLKIAK